MGISMSHSEFCTALATVSVGALGVLIALEVGDQRAARLRLAPEEALTATLNNVKTNDKGTLELMEVLNRFDKNGDRKLSDEEMQEAQKVAKSYTDTAIKMNEVSRSILQALEVYKKQELQK